MTISQLAKSTPQGSFSPSVKKLSFVPR